MGIPHSLAVHWALGAWVRGAEGHTIIQRLVFFVGRKDFTGLAQPQKGWMAESPRMQVWGADSQALDQQGRVWFYPPRLYSLNVQSQLFSKCPSKLVMTIILLQP